MTWRVGIDLGGTNCRGALVDTTGLVSSILCRPTPATADRSYLVAFLGDFIHELIASSETEISSIGLGVPGVISADGVVTVSPNLPQLNGFSLRSHLAKSFSLPVYVANDANAQAWGEAVCGAGRCFDSFAVITLGTGVGGGLVLHRQLWTGHDGAAGEIGHIMVEEDGLPCGCGAKGCLEQYASATALRRRAQALLATGKKSLLPAGDFSCATLFSVARQGDLLASQVVEEGGRRLGQVIAGLANLLNLDAILLCGGVAQGFDLLLPGIKREIVARCFDIPQRRLQILPGRLRDEAGILGSALLAH
ncbi:MAG: ROK family protein [Desulfuromonas sp.]|nr:MAG: ROK family protein [Desulfuromonas sp.]